MKYSLDRKAGRPAYLQLYRQLRNDIVQEVYSHGSRLPSKRLLSEELKLSTVTVEHAYALLCEEGYVEPRERSGYFVSFRSTDAYAVSANKAHAQIRRSDQSAPHDFPVSVLIKAMRKVMADYGEGILMKSPNAGCTELREAVSQYLNRSRGICADAGQIIVGSGAEYLYGLIVELLGRDRIYAIEAPSYEKIEQVYRACGVRYEKLPLRTNGIDSLSLASSKADVLHITPYRSYPSGVTATASKCHEYIRWSARPGRYIVEDDFESEFSVSAKPREPLFSLAGKDNIIYMNTFSKTISPSLRVGYMVLPECLLSVFEKKLGFYSCTVPTFEQYVLAELIAGGDFERHINRVRRHRRKELAGRG